MKTRPASLTRPKVWGKYSSNKGKITKITDYGCQVVKNLVLGKNVTVLDGNLQMQGPH